MKIKKTVVAFLVAKTVIKVVAVLAIFLLSGCLNSYTDYYKDYTSTLTAGGIGLEPYSGQTQLIHTCNLQVDANNWMEKGYMLVGESEFQNTNKPNESDIIEQAQKVGADVVLYFGEYLGTDKKIVERVHREPGEQITTTTTGNNGDTPYSKTQTITMPDRYYKTYDTVIINHYKHHATFWRKVNGYILGVHSTEIPRNQRSQLGRNMGAKVQLVVNNTPAFAANILPGDIITMVNAKLIISPEDLKEQLQLLAGTTVDITLLRNGEEMTIPVRLDFQ